MSLVVNVEIFCHTFPFIPISVIPKDSCFFQGADILHTIPRELHMQQKNRSLKGSQLCNHQAQPKSITAILARKRRS